MKVFIVDAFTDQIFSGNQAGVALVEGTFPPYMQKLAAELRHSETAFVLKTGERAFHLRYFTPGGEVALCGHATIAAFTVLREEGVVRPGCYRVSTLAGELELQVETEAVWMDMAPPQEVRGFSEAESAQLYAAYALPADAGPEGLRPAVVSAGLCDILLPVSRQALEAAVQDEAEVVRLSRQYDVVGVHLFCVEGEGTLTARCRNFAPRCAIPEEAATGTSNGALTYYLYRRGLVTAGVENRFIQGEHMGKPSEILSRITGPVGAERVRIGGRAVVALRCETVL